MARILKQEVKTQILQDNQLAADYCDQMGVLILSLPQMLARNNKRLTHVDHVQWLSKRIGKTIDEILTLPEPSVTV
jgi:hypothetical protein